MKTLPLSTIIDASLKYVVHNSKLYNIDESHSLTHSIEVLHYAKNIVRSELVNNPFLLEQKEIIYSSAILHDMCDNKYVCEKEGLERIEDFLIPLIGNKKTVVVKDIISSMSYSKVKVHGYPELGDYQLAYHIVRESDLLTAYNIPRSIVYNMLNLETTYSDSMMPVNSLFKSRMLQHINNKLFITDRSKTLAEALHDKLERDIADYNFLL